MNRFAYFNFARWYIHWGNGRQIDRCFGNELDKRYKEYRADPTNARSKAVIDLGSQAYVNVNVNVNENTEIEPRELENAFRNFAIRQIRVFVFPGHDSTSSYYLLRLSLSMDQSPYSPYLSCYKR